MPNTEAAVDQTSFLLGEVKGQLRELIHTSNNTAQKVDAIGAKVAALGGLPAVVAEHKADIAALGVRVDGLERERDERKGAHGIIAMMLKSPAIGWLAGAAVAMWAFLKGMKT